MSTPLATPARTILFNEVRHAQSLSSDLSDFGAHIIAGRLIELAVPIVKHYHSDLALDCLWVRDMLSTWRQEIRDTAEGGEPNPSWSFTFDFAADGWGTAIGTEPMYVHMMRHDLNVRVSVTFSDLRWDWTDTMGTLRWEIATI